MPILKWKHDYSVHIEELDQQHKDLIGMINYLHDSMKKRRGKEACYFLLKAMVDYAAIHFATEEKYLMEYGYPDYEAHRFEHLQFVEKVKEMEAGLQDKRLTLSMEIMTFLKEWVSEHLLITDKGYVSFLKEKGLK